MEENARFQLVFSKLREALDEWPPVKGEVSVQQIPEVTKEELDEIDSLRRIVLEVNEPVQMSYTTT